MSYTDILIPILYIPMIFSVIILCYAPVKNHLRYKRTATIIVVSVVCAILSVAVYISTVVLSNDFGWVNIIGIVILFIIYYRSLTVHISQSAAIFLLVSAFVTFIANFSIIFDAIMHPDGLLVDYSMEAFVFLLMLCIIFSCLFTFPLAKYGSYLIDHLQQPRVWWLSALVSAIFYLLNLRMVIHRYSTLHTNKVGVAYITVMITMFILLILLCIIYYMITNALIQKAETDDRNRILEMQEKQFTSLQGYLDADAKARHDFRQTIYTLIELSAKKDYAAIDVFLQRYIDELPQKDASDYCADSALNALLNHYSRKAVANEIPIEIKVTLPDTLYIDIVDVCSIVGNILENAITACDTVPKPDRFINLIISEEQNTELYIALSNSFSGKLSQIGTRYLSTHTGGNGIGLVSVSATAERYGGTANFSHKENVFYSDIMMKNLSSTISSTR